MLISVFFAQDLNFHVQDLIFNLYYYYNTDKNYAFKILKNVKEMGITLSTSQNVEIVKVNDESNKESTKKTVVKLKMLKQVLPFTIFFLVIILLLKFISF